jgi:hypothetical protein
MSRVLLIALDEREVVARCLAENVGISALERLSSGGVRLVCMSSEGAAAMTRTFKSHLMDGEVTRERFRRPSLRS